MIKKISKTLFKLGLYFGAGFLILSLISVLIFKFVPVPVTPLMIIRGIEHLEEGKAVKLEKCWVPRDEIPNHSQLAVVTSEDQNFLLHRGFDFEAIQKALKDNEKKKRKRGASTISQQTAKNVFLWPGRSWVRKGLEVYFTFLIETFWSKERIMTVYLNIIETGDGVYGIGGAAKSFYKKEASKMTRSESALIAAVLPNPRKFSIQNPSSYTLKRQKWVLRQMKYWDNKLDYESKASPAKKTKARRKSK